MENIMTKQKLTWILFLSSLPLLYYGFSNFAYQAVSSNLEALLISITCTLGLLFFFSSFYVYYNFDQYFTTDVKPNSSTIFADSIPDFVYWDDYSEKKAKPNSFINTKTKDIIMDVSNPPIITSVDLMKQEQQLNQRKEQLKQALEEVEQEKLQIQQSLQDRGWIRKINGEWTVG